MVIMSFNSLCLAYYNPNDTGSVGIFQVLAFIIGVSIILTAITLYLIG